MCAWGGTRIRKTSVAPRRGALFHDFYGFKLSRVSELFVALRGRPKEASRAPLDVPRTSEIAQNGLPHMGTDFTQGLVLHFCVSVVYDVLAVFDSLLAITASTTFPSRTCG